MKLYDFEEIVDSTIVDRGLEYYEAGFVTNLVRVGDGRYNALVEGADMYGIAVELDEEYNVLSSSCDCPFNMEPVCKHEVAVYYELIERLKDNDIPEVAGGSAAASQPDLKAVLENLSKAKLIDLLIELAESDPILHNELLFKYAIVEEQQEVESCKRLIESIIEKYRSGEGFISHHSASSFADELSVVLGKIETMKDPLIAIEVAGLLLIEAVKSIQYTDDSGGEIGSLINKAMETIKTYANAPLESGKQSELLAMLIHLSKDVAFEGWDDFRIDVLGICTSFAEDEQLRKMVMNEWESMIVDSSANHYNRYGNERILNLMYEIIETYGATGEAKKFLHRNINYPSFRKRMMQNEMDEGNYENVLTLASEGERIDKDYLGLVTRWKKWRYKAYKHLKSFEEQTEMGRDLLLAGNFEYYYELKGLASDKKAFYDDLKQDLAEKNEELYVRLIEVENDVDAIFEYVRENPSSVERYLKYLMDSHEEETIQLFEFHVKTLAENAFNQKQYKEVCQVLRRFRINAGREAQQSLAEELKMTYKNRPAFLEELDKLYT